MNRAIYLKLAEYLRGFAADEVKLLKDYDRRPAHRKLPEREAIAPCIGCGRRTYNGGICDQCWELVAGACQWRASSK